jgi:hypothetical protein
LRWRTVTFPSPGRSWLALCLLAGCGGDGPPARACDRLGLLCGDQDRPQGLDVRDSRGVTGDLDGDGFRELVTAADSGLSIAWGHADLRDYRLIPGGAPGAAIGDIDGDGDLDVAFITAEPATLRVLENRGARQLVDGPTIKLAGRAQSLWLGPLDADDSLDAVVASADPGTLTIVRDGLTRTDKITVGADLSAVTTGDLDGDGQLDLVTIDRSGAAIHVALAQGAGFAAPRRVATGLHPEHLQLHDLDGDGHLDALTHGTSADIWFHAGDGAGGFASGRSLIVQDGASPGFGAHRDEQGRRWLITVDDGHPIAHQLDDADSVVQRTVAGGILHATGLDMDAGAPLTHGTSLGERHSLASSYVFTELWHGGEASLEPIAIGDVDQDGELDLVTVEADEITVRRRLADGTDPSWAEPWSLARPHHVVALAIADVTGDGLPDLVVGDSAPSIYVAIGAGDGSFTPAPPVPLDATPYRLHAGLTAPGEPAAVAHGGHDAPGVAVLRFDAAGALLDRTVVYPTDNPTRLTSADLDADGDQDLVVLTATISLVLIPREADGWGPATARSLADLHLEVLPDQPLQSPDIALGDIDLDGRVDAVMVASSAVVRLMDIAADPPPAPQLDEQLGLHYPETLGLADVDGEGQLDLVTCSSSDLQISLITADGELQPQAPHDQFIFRCALHIDPDERKATAVTATDRGYSVLRPDFAPALARTDIFEGGPDPLQYIATGDVDADGLTDIVVSDESMSLAVLWGDPDGQPRRATWTSGSLYDTRADPVVGPLDDRPGDEIITAWGTWTYQDGALRRLSTGAQLTGHFPRALGLQARAGERSDLIVLATQPQGQAAILAIPVDPDGALRNDAEVMLWSGPWSGDDAVLAIADYDSDGYDDIAALNRSSIPVPGLRVVVVWGDRDRAVLEPTMDFPWPVPSTIASADLDADGAPELFLGANFGVVSVEFTGREPNPLVPIAAPLTSDILHAADLDADGHTDLVLGNDGELKIVLGPRADDLTARLDVSPAWTQLRAADLDGDEILDLVGLLDGAVVTRLSGPRLTATP